MMRDFRGQHLLSKDIIDHIVEGDKSDIRECDIVLANVWRDSVGTSMEIIHAYSTGKQVITISHGRELSPWIQYHSTKVFPAVAEAITYLRKVGIENAVAPGSIGSDKLSRC
jgi:nucleoside 2-deoxyribosyltransferase